MSAKNLTRTREQEDQTPNRDFESRDEEWLPPSVLDAPPPREGFRQRWIATRILGEETPAHTMRRFREGWVPRKKDTLPEGFHAPTINHGQYADVIGVEGMILCEMPKSRVEARDRYYRQKSIDQNISVEKDLQRIERANGERFAEKQFKAGVQRGQRVADDE